jgi:hypothetical protein
MYVQTVSLHFKLEFKDNDLTGCVVVLWSGSKGSALPPSESPPARKQGTPGGWQLKWCGHKIASQLIFGFHISVTHDVLHNDDLSIKSFRSLVPAPPVL